MEIREVDYKFISALKREDYGEVEALLTTKRLLLTGWIADLGVTALHLAVGYGTESFGTCVTHCLLKHGSDPNAPSACGKTPVHVAAAWGRVQVLHLLLLHGGDPWRQDDERKNVFNYAFESKAWDVLKVLHEYQLASPKKCCRVALSPIFQKNYVPDLLSEESYIDEEKEPPEKQYISSNEFIISQDHDIQLEACNLQESFFNQSDFVSFDSPNKVENITDFPPENGQISDFSSIEEANTELSSIEEKITELPTSKEEKNKTYTILQETTSPPVCNTNNLFSELLSAVKKREMRISGIETLHSWDENVIKDEEIKTEIINVSDDSVAFVSLSPETSGLYESCETPSTFVHECRTTPAQDELDEMRAKLRDLGMNPGPITQSTKAIYQRQLERLLKQGFTSPPPKLPSDLHTQSPCNGDPGLNYSPELISALDNPASTDYADLEKILCTYFSKPEFKGSPKTCFNYLLLDGRKTLDLPRRAESLSPKETLSQFLAAIFYVGKGQAGRPYAHLHLARQTYAANQEPEHPKEKTIIDAWRSGHGIVCLQVFHNIISDEALTREAAMIHALGRHHLHNQRKGDYRGCVRLWDPVRQRMLGVHLLLKAKEIFLRDEERPLFVNDF